MKRVVQSINTHSAACLLAVAFTVSAHAGQNTPAAKPPSLAGPPAAPAPGAIAPAPTVPPQTVVLKAGGREVTAGELDAIVRGANGEGGQVSPAARKNAAEQYGIMLVLAQEGEKERIDQSPEFQHQLDMLRTRLLAQAAFRNVNDAAKVSKQEIDQYYSEHGVEYEQVEVRQFTVNKRAAGAPASATGLPEAEAKIKLADIRKAVESGTAAEKIAKDFGSAGTVAIDLQSRQLPVTSLTPEISKKLLPLKDGGLTEDIDTPQSVMFMQLVKHGKKDVQQVSSQIEARLHQQKVRSAMDELKKQANVWIDPDYTSPAANLGAPSSPGSSGTPPQPSAHP